MSKWDLRRSVSNLHRSAGLAPRGFEALEALENRVLLNGDPFPSATFLNIDELTGWAASADSIENVADTPFFKFTALRDDFVSVLADTQNIDGGSDLNTALEIYDCDGGLLFSSMNNGELSSGTAEDAWAGFVAEEGEDYYARVLSEDGSVGDFRLYIRALSDDSSVSLITTPPLQKPPTLGEHFDPIAQTTTVVDVLGGTLDPFGELVPHDVDMRPSRQDEIVYRITAGSHVEFDSMASVSAFDSGADAEELDTHLDIYDSEGNLVTSDIQRSFLTSAFTDWRSAPDETYYVRVRSDEIGDPEDVPSGGEFGMRVDFAAEVLNVDPVTRKLDYTAESVADSYDYTLQRFMTQGSGLTIITAKGQPFADVALTIYDDEGNQIAFVDNFAGDEAEVRLNLEGGEEYFVLVDAFDGVSLPTGVRLYIDSHHTYDDNQGIDDHIDLPTTAESPDWELATPIRFGDPFLPTDAYGIERVDFDWQALGVVEGRFYDDTDDSDLFSFVAPKDMLRDYEGSDDDQGTSIFAGGMYTTSGEAETSSISKFNGERWFNIGAGVAIGEDPGIVRSLVSWDHDGDGVPWVIYGGEFDTVPGAPNGLGLPFTNIAAWDPTEAVWDFDFNQDALTPSPALSGPDGPIYAMLPFDDTPDDTTDPLVLIVAGEFTSVNGGAIPATNLAKLRFVPGPFGGGSYQWEAFAEPGGPTTGAVRALTIWDPPSYQQGEDDIDLEPQLIIGGEFNQGLTSYGLNAADEPAIAWNNVPFDRGVDGSVYTLTVWDPPAESEEFDSEPALAVGGEFTDRGSNVAYFGNNIEVQGEDEVDVLEWFSLGAGTDGPVYALEALTPPVGFQFAFGTEGQLLYIGGDYGMADGAPSNNISMWHHTDVAMTQVGWGVDGPVYTIELIQEEEERFAYGNPDFETFPWLFDETDFLAIGGEFENISRPFFFGGPIPAANAVRAGWPNFLGDQLFPMNQTWNGTDGAIYTMLEFDDDLAGVWDDADRARSRATITLAGTDAGFFNSQINIYDSNKELIYTNTTKAPPFPEPSGTTDPHVSPAGEAFEAPEMWGGETYYIEVVREGGLSGRYQLSVQVATFPAEDDTPNDGNYDSSISIIGEMPGAGEFAAAEAGGDISTDTNGDGDNYQNSAAAPHVTGNTIETWDRVASGFQFITAGDLGQIHSLTDSDMYSFRAEADGYVEVRVATTGLADEFLEYQGTLNEGTGQYDFDVLAAKTKTYDSFLDSSIRVFNNDFEQIGYNDDNPAVAGRVGTADVGTAFQDVQYQRRDGRIIIPVVENERYYLLIESGQLYADGAPEAEEDRVLREETEIDWRYATGSYRLFVHQMQNFNLYTDDHADVLPNATPLLVDSATGDASASGEIRDEPFNPPFDADIFAYTMVGTGEFTVSVARDPSDPSTLVPTIQLFDELGALRAQAPGNSSGLATLDFEGSIGERYFIVVTGQSVSANGDDYLLNVDGPAFEDDFADIGDLHAVTDFEMYDHLGGGTMSGNIEYAGDTDLFRFEAFDFQTMTILAESPSGDLNPRILVWEQSVDPTGRPVLLLIGNNDNLNENTENAGAVIQTNTDRITTDVNGDPIELPYYYVAVLGSDGQADAGDYELTISFDTTDDHADAGEFDLATQIAIPSSTGLGSATGVIESDGDDDLFWFVAPAGGPTELTVGVNTGATLVPSITLMDEQGNVLAGPATGVPAALSGTIVQKGAKYFVLVDSDGTDGGYTLNIETPAIDDHANIGEFDDATLLTLNPETGDAEIDARMEPDALDTDLFVFTTLEEGSHEITITPDVTSIFAGMAMTVQVFSFLDLDDPVVEGTSSAFNEPVTVSFDATGGDEQYYVLIATDRSLSTTRQGDYNLSIDGQGGDSGDPSDDPAFIDFGSPQQIVLNSKTGDGEASAEIEIANDRDLFTFTISDADRTRSSRVFVQVVTPEGSLLNASVTILDAADEDSVAGFDSQGIPGANANASIDANPGDQLWIVVDGLGSGTGSYTLRVDTEPEVFYSYYPEGFASPSINEFVSIANPNDFAVTYSIVLRYETGDRDQVVVSNATIGAGSRSGVTLSGTQFGEPAASRDFAPYAVEIQSNGPLGATMAHYDFGSTVGDAFAEAPSDRWAFARVEKNPGNVNDFVVFYNPNDFAVEVSMLVHLEGGGTVLQVQTVEALRRGGWSINDTASITTGMHAATISARPVDSANEDAFDGVVAGLSHFDASAGAGFGLLGDASGGSTFSVVPSLTNGDSSLAEVAIYNPTPDAASVTIGGDYIRADLPFTSRVVTIQPFSSTVLAGSELGLIRNQPVGLTFTSNVGVSVVANEMQLGEANASGASNTAGTGWFFGDAFINKDLAGEMYFEILNFYNPTSEDMTVTVELLFSTSDIESFTVNVGANGFAEVLLHDHPSILNRDAQLNFFSISASADAPFVTSLVHYDLFLDGGWGNSGSSIGLLNPINTIV